MHAAREERKEGAREGHQSRGCTETRDRDGGKRRGWQERRRLVFMERQGDSW